MNGCIHNDDLKWNQNKINVIWKKCEEFYEDYGVQVDPRLLLAIIVEEGTGSFNTSSDNKAGDEEMVLKLILRSIAKKQLIY